MPILANMTEFGKTPLLDAATLESLGVNVVIYPVTLLRLAMGAAEAGLRALLAERHPAGRRRRDADPRAPVRAASTTRPTAPSTTRSTTSRSTLEATEVAGAGSDDQTGTRRRRSPTRPRSRWSTRRRTRSSTAATRCRSSRHRAASRRSPTSSGTASCPRQIELAALRAHRALPPRRCRTAVLDVLGALPTSCHPMDVLRTAVSFLGASDPEEDDDVARGEPAQVDRDDGEAPDGRRVRTAPSTRPGAARPRPRPRPSPRTSSTCASARCPSPRSCAASRSR